MMITSIFLSSAASRSGGRVVRLHLSMEIYFSCSCFEGEVEHAQLLDT